MARSVAGRWVSALALLVLVACGEVPADSPPAALEVVDIEGRTVALAAPARRVISLVPSITGTVLALGMGDRLVGRTDFDSDPAVADLPSVGGGLGPDLEAIAAVAPDLVIRFAGESDRSTPNRLDDLGIAHLAVRPDRIADVFTSIEQVGALLGADAAAILLIDSLRADLDAIRAEVAGRPTIRAAYLMGGSPPWTTGAGSYIDELITLAGGENVFADLTGLYGAISPEVVATRDIDVILLAEGAEIDARLLEGRTVRRIPSSVQIPGPRLAVAARTVADAIHGGDRP